jgi:hypothetical protein
MGIILTWSTGCSRINRENVFANTETGTGIFLCENNKTQLYELKIGYFRHELFWVPTSKFVAYQTADGNSPEAKDPAPQNDPSETPEVLGEISVGGIFGGTAEKAQVSLSQRLAVGKRAVESAAAAAMMADSPSKASAASAVATRVPIAAAGRSVTTDDAKLTVAYDTLIESGKDKTITEDGQTFNGMAAYAEYKANELYPGDTASNIRNVERGEKLRRLVEGLQRIP